MTVRCSTTSVDPQSTAVTTTDVNAALAAKLPTTLEILNSASAQDKDSVTVTAAFAQEHHLTSITQLKPIASTMTFGGPPEFIYPRRRTGRLEEELQPGVQGILPARRKSGPITLAALADGKVQAADIFTTTPQIITEHLVSLADPEFNFAAQNVTPLVYKPAINPQAPPPAARSTRSRPS